MEMDASLQAGIYVDAVKHVTVMAMENLMDYLILAFLLLGLAGFFGTYAIGWITLRAAVNGCVAVFGGSSFAMWARSQKSEISLPPHDGESEDEKQQTS